MPQGFIAGGTSYENQSLSDILTDIQNWINISNETLDFFVKTTDEVKNSDFFKKVPYEYKAMIYEVPQICKTNIEDFTKVFEAINKNELSKDKVELFRKIGVRAFASNEDNKKYFKSRDDGYWHDYDNADFRKIEKLYQEYGDYTATLWDVTNAASRLLDYVDVVKDVINMKYEDKSINIGDGNTIVDSAIGTNNKNNHNRASKNKESLFSKIIWKLVIPIIVGIAIVIILAWLGFEN